MPLFKLIDVSQVACDTFGLSYAVVDCSSGISLDAFCEAILIEDDDQIDREVSHETHGTSLVRDFKLSYMATTPLTLCEASDSAS